MQQLADRLSSMYLGDVLDVGAGRGGSAKFLMESSAGFDRIIGIDAFSEVLKDARASIEDKRVKFLEMPAEAMAFADCEFDTVNITNALHHLSNPGKALNEMVRVLKPGGMLVVNEMHTTAPNPRQLTYMLCHHLNAKIDTILGVSHNPTFERAEIIDMVSATGVEIADVLEWSEPESGVWEGDDRDAIAAALDKNVERLQGLPEYDAVRQEAEEIKARIYETGSTRPGQVVVFGRKS